MLLASDQGCSRSERLEMRRAKNSSKNCESENSRSDLLTGAVFVLPSRRRDPFLDAG